jgi:hypothetical protein
MWRDQVKLRYSSTSAEIPKTGQNTRIQRGEQWDLFFFSPTLRCCWATVVAAPASDGAKNQLPSAFAWVVGHGGCAVRRELVRSVLHKRSEKLCMARWHASPLLPRYRTCSAYSKKYLNPVYLTRTNPPPCRYLTWSRHKCPSGGRW